MISRDAIIHPRAHVDESVTIGPGTRVWQMASVTRGTVLGADCVVRQVALGQLGGGSRQRREHRRECGYPARCQNWRWRGRRGRGRSE